MNERAASCSFTRGRSSQSPNFTTQVGPTSAPSYCVTKKRGLGQQGVPGAGLKESGGRQMQTNLLHRLPWGSSFSMAHSNPCKLAKQRAHHSASKTIWSLMHETRGACCGCCAVGLRLFPHSGNKNFANALLATCITPSALLGTASRGSTANPGPEMANDLGKGRPLLRCLTQAALHKVHKALQLFSRAACRPGNRLKVWNRRPAPLDDSCRDL